MGNYSYEIHVFPDPLLPFLFHREFVVTTERRVFNWHENIELLSCTEGSGYVICGSKVLPFEKGDILVVNASLPHSIGSKSRVRYRCLIIDDSFFLENGIAISRLRFRERICDPAMTQLFENVAEAYRCADAHPFPALEIRCAVLGLVKQLCACCIIDAAPGEGINANIANAIRYIRANYASQLTLDQIAEHVGISKYHLCREFKAFTGSSIVQTVNLLRCTQAKLLMEGGSSVSAAALSCGFDNLSYFSRTFKKLMGVLPSQLTSQ